MSFLNGLSSIINLEIVLNRIRFRYDLENLGEILTLKFKTSEKNIDSNFMDNALASTSARL